MACTDRHYRYLLRIITRHALLYTEMVTTGAILFGDRERYLRFDAFEHPVALQLGGSDPTAMAECAKFGAEQGYDEVNINVGCPSDRVQSGRFGACLMAEPDTVARCVDAMRQATDVSITVKTRIGIDELDSFDALCAFVTAVANAGCQTFIVHARKAWLKGLSPRENREIPPLRYDVVEKLKSVFPDLTIILNGGITDVPNGRAHLSYVDGIMVGREAYRNPAALADVDSLYFDRTYAPQTREQIARRYMEYVDNALSEGTPLLRMTRHLIGLYQGVPGGRAWRRHLSEHAHRKGAGIEVIEDALHKVQSYMTR